MSKNLKEIGITPDLLTIFYQKGWSDDRVIKEGRYIYHRVKSANTAWQKRLVEQMEDAEMFRKDIDPRSFCVASFYSYLFGDKFGPKSWKELIDDPVLYEMYENLTGADRIVEFLQNEFGARDAYIAINHFGLDTGKPVDFPNMGLSKMNGQGALKRIRMRFTPERTRRLREFTAR